MANEFKKTMNLPKTEFPMRASLAQREPERLRKWNENHVYEQLMKKNEGHDKFVLHDGPPYANGPIHIGHALNKISKDIINRFWSMRGYQTPYVPGWDCHGQPIEHKVETDLGSEKFNSLPAATIRRICREYAVENVDVQRNGFKRLGVLAEWDNPYLTFTHDYDAADVQIFKAIFDKGAIYRGSKPVHWCKHCHTALAEAEIEYGNEKSPAIFVRFALRDVPSGLEAFEGKTDVIIWTTTPWTLPANAGVALNPDETYVAALIDGRAEILAEALVERVAEIAGWENVEFAMNPNGERWSATGSELLGLTYTHPIFSDYAGKFIVADYVSMEDGTGCVHTAPGHGVDDYNAGNKFDLPVIMPVDDDGKLYKGEGIGTGGIFGGLDTDEASPKIIEWLKEQGTLVAHRDIEHSYPHCWRCKNPVIFRATSQWFVSMDKTGLRQSALDAINNDVKWYPAHASKRISSMVEGRPDWCISRQRSWGVPIPSFTCADCGETVMNDATLDAVIALFKEKGSDAWFTDEPASYLGDACECPKCHSHNLKADKDILDVWWDSGVSHTAVLDNRPDLHRPADMYLEGSDQHRGWFQSSLLTSVGAYDEAPYKAVVSQGFVLDGNNRKMSKSLGNVIDPNQVCDTQGADIIRLWVSSVDSSSDVPCDMEILSRVGDAYRRFRNTLRFLLGELEGQFDADQMLPVSDLEMYDKLVLARMCQVHDEVTKAYESYKFTGVYRTLYDYVTELSNGYLNATKDRMYCGGVDSHERRSAQTTWAYILSMLVHDMQPILAYTTDEAMEFMPEGLKEGQEFAALLDWFQNPMDEKMVSELLPVYDDMVEVRSAYTKAYETALEEGVVEEKTTQATRATVYAPEKVVSELQGKVDMAEVLVCSSVDFEVADEISVKVAPAEGVRCPRCWNWRPEAEDGLCERCHEVLSNMEK